MPKPAEKAARGISPILLVLAALCFLLPFAGVSCNTAAGSAALGGALSGAGSNAGNGAAASQCLQALNGKDLATWSGVNFVTGGNPSTPSSFPGCPPSTASPSSSGDQGAIGVQPLMVVVLILIVVGIAATALRTPLRWFVAGGAALLAAVLVIVNNSNVHNVILDKLTTSGSSSGSLSSLGISGTTAAAFFDVHAAIGFTLILVALFAALAANAVACGLGYAARPSKEGGAPPSVPPWSPPPDTSPPGTPPTEPPPG